MENQHFLTLLFKRNKDKASVLVYREPVHTDQYLQYSSHYPTKCKESGVFILFNRVYSIITNKDNLTKETLE